MTFEQEEGSKEQWSGEAHDLVSFILGEDPGTVWRVWAAKHKVTEGTEQIVPA